MTRTFRFAVLGDPIDHSRSPVIHTEALRLAGLSGTYERIRTPLSGMKAAIDRLLEGEFDGYNVTMPLKGVAAEMSDRLTPEARRSGSVNTLRVRDGDVDGHSTDVVAFRQIIDDGTFGEVRSVHVLGAGGSARAALGALSGIKTWVSARNRAAASRLTQEFECESLDWGLGVDGALVVNATPLGMTGESLPSAVIDAAGGLLDLPYGDSSTPSILALSERGLPVVDGYEFLAAQAAASFLWWTDAQVELPPLVRAARNA